MIKEYIGLNQIEGSLVVLDGVKNPGYEEVVEFNVAGEGKRKGRIIQIEGERVVVQVFEGTKGLSLKNTGTVPTGRPIDGFGEIYPEVSADINGSSINPVSRVYPRNFISTGISSIDALSTLIRGQKLPIFSGYGMKHNELAVQIVRQAKITGATSNDFAVVFAAMGVKNDVADYFRRSFEESGVLSKVVMFLNLSDDPIIERTITPRCALTAAEYLAFEKGMHILVVMTDMSSYCEALREFSSSKGEIPGRKGYPG